MPRSIPIAGLPVGISIRPDAKDGEKKREKRDKKISGEILLHYIHK